MFDERKLEKHHIEKALEFFINNNPSHFPAKSAFVNYQGRKLPAKFILRLAFKELTGVMPKGEQITGGKASIRVLQNLGFDAVYEKKPAKLNRNPVKNARREAFRQILEKKFGKVELEAKFDFIKVPDFQNRDSIPYELRKILDEIEKSRNINIKGKKNLKLRCDYYIPDINLIIEFDENQHFTPLRAVSLKFYPENIKTGFDIKRWEQLCDQIKAGDNSPLYRDEQRAFYDSIRDIAAFRAGFPPLVRIYENDVLWEKESHGTNADKIISDIEKIL
jgi:hypothetical protein